MNIFFMSTHYKNVSGHRSSKQFQNGRYRGWHLGGLGADLRSNNDVNNCIQVMYKIIYLEMVEVLLCECMTLVQPFLSTFLKILSMSFESALDFGCSMAFWWSKKWSVSVKKTVANCDWMLRGSNIV